MRPAPRFTLAGVVMLAGLAVLAPSASAGVVRPTTAAEALPVEVVTGVHPGGVSHARSSTRASAVGTWAEQEIARVLGDGLLPGVSMRSFRPQAPLDGATTAALVRGSFPTFRGNRRLASDKDVTIFQLDSAFIVGAGLSTATARARIALEQHGLAPRNLAGVEIAARLLGLRYNHPSGTDDLELSPNEVATRAEGAYSAAQALDFEGWEPEYAASIMAMLDDLPAYKGEQLAALRRAVFLLGQPYVWGGEWPHPDSPYGTQAHGGYDCSGFVWRVMALDPAAPAGALDRLGGRTTYDMARTTPAAKRLTRARVRPGDLLLFATDGPNRGVKTPYGTIGHVAIALSSTLFIHSSSQGVAIQRWDTGWYANEFAFGKHVLP